jgi:hypothetical protein
MASVRMDYPRKRPFSQEVNIGYNQLNFFNPTRTFFGEETAIFLTQDEKFLNFNIGVPSSNDAKWEYGVTVASQTDNYFQNSSYYNRDDQYDNNYFDLMKLYVQYELNTQKKQYYSNQGTHFTSKLYLINGKERNVPGSTGEIHAEESILHHWVGLRTKYTTFIPHSSRITYGLFADVSLSTQELFTTYTASKFKAPLFNPIPEISTQFLPTFRDYNFFALGMKTIYKFSNYIDFRLEGYLYQPIWEIKSIENAKAKFSNPFESQYLIFSAIGVYNSRFGPLSVSLNYQQKTEPPVSLNLNFGYILFNRRVLD